MKNLLLGLLIVPTIVTAQTAIPDYKTAKNDFFWDRLYATGGVGLYCNQPVEKHPRSVEHVYPADWMVDHYRENGHPECKNRKDCPVHAFHYAAADLHNLWPAIANVNSSRSNHPFAELDDDRNYHHKKFMEKFDCDDFERRGTRGGTTPAVEPRDSVKGDVARSLLYMAEEYGFPLHGMRDMLEKWNLQDPADYTEMWRNDAIQRMQGTSNRFITDSYSGSE